MNSKPLRILYINYKGETKVRNIIPQEIYYGSNDWHIEEQWLIDAIDIDKGALRTFAMAGIIFIYGEEDDKKLSIIRGQLF